MSHLSWRPPPPLYAALSSDAGNFNPGNRGGNQGNSNPANSNPGFGNSNPSYRASVISGNQRHSTNATRQHDGSHNATRQSPNDQSNAHGGGRPTSRDLAENIRQSAVAVQQGEKWRHPEAPQPHARRSINR
jgi:hypothetical protein